MQNSNRLGRIEDLHNETMAMVVAVANATASGVVCNSSSTADLREDFEGRLADCGCGGGDGVEGKTAARPSCAIPILGSQLEVIFSIVCAPGNLFNLFQARKVFVPDGRRQSKREQEREERGREETKAF